MDQEAIKKILPPRDNMLLVLKLWTVSPTQNITSAAMSGS